MNKINKLLFFLFILFISSGFITLSTVSASTGTVPYEFEVGIPGIVPKGGSLPAMSLNNVLNKIIKGLFPIAGILAFAMIVYAGFEYATSGGDTNKQKDAQDRIANAIIGLLLLFAFYIIIYTINPDILKTQELTLEPVTLPSITIQANMTKLNDYGFPLSYALLQGFAYVENNFGDCLGQLRSQLLNNNIEWTITEACTTNTSPCQTLVSHEDPCHSQGTCVDAVVDDPSQRDQFIELANKEGLDVLDEYKCNFTTTTGGSFHIRWHQNSCQNDGCWNCAQKTGC